MLEVLAPGLLSTIQDAGRPDAVDLGIPPGGACDPWSLAVANLLHGNPPEAAALEITLAGLELLVRETCTVAFAGADLGVVSVNGRRPLSPGIVHVVWAGSRLRFEGASGAHASGAHASGPHASGAHTSGARAYLSLAGGIDVPRVLGSASTCLVGGFGGIDGRALQAGDVLRPVRAGDLTPGGRTWPGTLAAGVRAQDSPVRVVAGPHVEQLGERPLRKLTSTEWRVEPDSDRMGVRLAGPRLGTRTRHGSMISVPMVWGSIQLPEDGGPIVLLADHQTIGGYPVIAVVIRADRPRIGQLAPGAAVRFETVSLEVSRAAYREQQAELRRAALGLARSESWETAWLEAGG
jgi:allophanate hydrolase subunit 2